MVVGRRTSDKPRYPTVEEINVKKRESEISSLKKQITKSKDYKQRIQLELRLQEILNIID